MFQRITILDLIVYAMIGMVVTSVMSNGNYKLPKMITNIQQSIEDSI